MALTNTYAQVAAAIEGLPPDLQLSALKVVLQNIALLADEQGNAGAVSGAAAAAVSAVSLRVGTVEFTALQDGQTDFGAASLTAGYSAIPSANADLIQVTRDRFPGRLRPFLNGSGDYTFTNGVLTLVSPNPAVDAGETLAVVYQANAQLAAVNVQFRQNAGNLEVTTNNGTSWTSLGSISSLLTNTQTYVADITAAGTPNNTFSYTPKADDGTRTRLEKVGGEVFETAQLTLYVP